MRICHPRLAPSMIGPPRHGHPRVILVDEHAPHVERLLVPREETSVRLPSEAKGPKLLRVRKRRATVSVRAVHVVRCRVKCASAEVVDSVPLCRVGLSLPGMELPVFGSGKTMTTRGSSASTSSESSNLASI